MLIDARGRRISSGLKRQPTGKRVELLDDGLYLATKLQDHGDLSSKYLKAFMLQLGRAENKNRGDRLTDLFHETNTPHGGAYFDRAEKQDPKLPNDYWPGNWEYWYTNSLYAEEALIDEKLYAPVPRSSAWWHDAMVAAITASIELSCTKLGLRYIRQQDILGDRLLEFPLTFTPPPPEDSPHLKMEPVERTLKPDALFGIEYKGGVRYFLVEADRGTEMQNPQKNKNRKTIIGSFLQYREFVGTKQYKKALGITQPILVLTFTKGHARQQRMIDMLQKLNPKGFNYMLFKTYTHFAGARYTAPPILWDILTEPFATPLGSFPIDK